MLQHLFIQNYALIETLDIDFKSGFSVITGETGAGKSILLGAIGLLLGQRADTKSIRTGAQRCIIEAQFDLSAYPMQSLFEEIDIDFDGKECIIRRELNASGKTRAFINDTPAGVSQLKTLGDHLIDIHSQHQNLLLAKEDFQLSVLDILAHNQQDLHAYKGAFLELRHTEKELEQTREQLQQAQTELDYLSFQLQQLEEANLQQGEDEELEQEQQRLEHAEDIKSALYQTSELLNADNNSVLQALRSAQHHMESIADVFPDANELAERLESCYIELKDIASETENEAEEVEFNPQRLAFVEERLSTIYELERKHHVESIDELLYLREDLQTRVSSITHSDERIAELERLVAQQRTAVEEKAKRLTQQRKEAAVQVEEVMSRTLIPLGMPNIQFHVEISERANLESTGKDKVTFLFSANKNMALQPISQVASGGEIARVMLSLKYLISGAISLPTIIFDEIDTGVSGQIAEKMALIMKEMGEAHHRQVISITHLPQIAALGMQHYRVYKEDNEDTTNSHIVHLTEEERVEEIAHMLSGSTLTEAALNNARALIYK